MKSLNPQSIHPPFANYSHGVEAQAGRIVVTSGQLGIHADGTIPPGAEAQTDLCLKNIEAILSEAHLSRDAIVRLNAYVVDRQHMAGYMRACDRFTDSLECKPASTLMIVSGFTRPEFLVEVEAIAIERN